MIDCGTRDEANPTEFGLAHYVEHILFKGTRKRDSWHINNRMESVGGELNAFTTKEETTFYSVFLHRDLARAVELLSDLVCHPTAPAHELENEQEVVVDEINSYRDTPSELIYDEFENRLFAGQALGHNILGSEDTVRTFDNSRCLNFIDRHYTPARMVFFHVGQASFDQVVRLVERHFDRPETIGEQPFRTKLSPDAPLPIEQTVQLRQDTHQAHVLLGTRSYPIGHPDAPALSIINNVLGGPGMNSRLNLELRERRGLVYTVESTLTSYTDAGYLSIYFGCDHEDLKRCRHICQSQLDRMRTSGLTARQLSAAQKQLKGQIGIGAANLENSTIALAKNILRRGHSPSLDEIAERIDSVTVDQIRRVAEEILSPERMRCVVIQ